MGTWLRSRTDGCCVGLKNISNIYQTMAHWISLANYQYEMNAQLASNPRYYQGQGANAFVQAVDKDIHRSQNCLLWLEDATDATSKLQQSLANSSQRYDDLLTALSDQHQELAAIVSVPALIVSGPALIDKLITGTLEAVGTEQQLLEDVLNTGSMCILSVWPDVVAAVESQIEQSFSTYWHSLNKKITAK